MTNVAADPHRIQRLVPALNSLSWNRCELDPMVAARGLCGAKYWIQMEDIHLLREMGGVELILCVMMCFFGRKASAKNCNIFL